MKTKLIEATSNGFNHGKFLVGRMDTEWSVRSAVDGRPLVSGRGWTRDHLWICDLATGEGACFRPGGLASADLNKHAIWVCPLFEPLLAWLYRQDLTDLDALPAIVDLPDARNAMHGYRRPGPNAETGT